MIPRAASGRAAFNLDISGRRGWKTLSRQSGTWPSCQGEGWRRCGVYKRRWLCEDRFWTGLFQGM